MKHILGILLILLVGSAAAQQMPDLTQLKSMAARFAPTQMRVDTSKLSPADAKALVKLIEVRDYF